MWEHRCMYKGKKHRCKRKSVNALWCFAFQSEKFDHVTWIETCGNHMAEASRIVSWLKI